MYENAMNGVITYLRGIIKQFDQGFSTPEDQELFLSNVFEEVKKDFVGLTTHSSISFFVQKLVNRANAAQLEGILRCLLPCFQTLVVDKSGTYVIQHIFGKATNFFDSDNGSEIMKLIYQMGLLLLEHELMTERHATFSVHCLIVVMSGKRAARLADSHYCPVRSQMKEHEFYPEFAKLMHAYTTSFLPTSPSTFELINHEPSTALAQALLNALKKVDKDYYAQVCQSIVNNGFFDQLDDDGLPDVMTSKAGSYYSSALIGAMDDDSIALLIEKVIEPRFLELAAHPAANHCVEQLMARLSTGMLHRQMFVLLRGKMFQLLANNRAGIITHLCARAVNLADLQPLIVEGWKEEMSASKANFVISVAVSSASYKMNDSEICRALSKMPYLHMTFLQNMLRFKDSSYICSSLAGLSVEQKVSFACSKSGSYVLEVMLMQRPTEYKQQFIQSLKDHYPIMVTDICGSKVFERCWPLMNVPQKTEVIAGLAKSVAAITGTLSGKCVARNIRLTDYIYYRTEWDQWVMLQKSFKPMKTNQEAGTGKSAPVKKEEKSFVGNGDTKPTETVKAVKNEPTVDKEGIKTPGKVKVVKKKKPAIESKVVETPEEVKVVKKEKAPMVESNGIEPMVTSVKKKRKSVVDGVADTPDPISKKRSVPKISPVDVTPALKTKRKSMVEGGSAVDIATPRLVKSGIKKKKKSL